MNSNFSKTSDSLSPQLEEILAKTCKKIAPLWPLKNFVAVNPFLGLTEMKFETAANYLAQVGGISLTLPKDFYLQKIKEGQIGVEDLQLNGFSVDPTNKENTKLPELQNFSDVASLKTGHDWNHYLITRITSWASAYFDQGQANWVAANQNTGIFQAWKTEASIDLSPEIAGLKNFRKQVKSFSDNPNKALQEALQILDIPEKSLPTYLHRLLLKVGGWSGYIAQLDWESELYGEKGGKLSEFLTILVCWEASMKLSLNTPALSLLWEKAKHQHQKCEPEKLVPQQLTERLKLQESFDRATQQKLISKFKSAPLLSPIPASRPKAQAVFCIDVRSEVYRRNLEAADSEIETFGFAGFFGFPIQYIPFGHEHSESLCPVLIPAGIQISETASQAEQEQSLLNSKIRKFQLGKLWKSFKSGAVTCFSFVSPLGIFYLFRLFAASLRMSKFGLQVSNLKGKSAAIASTKISLNEEVKNGMALGIPLEQQVKMAQSALKAMSLPDQLAKFVLIVGHGSHSVNNPHASGLDCGACGGHSGEVNSQVAAAVLNNPQVRENLKSLGIHIPEDTVFLAALHNTVTDEVSILNSELVSPNQKEEFQSLQASLEQAGKLTRLERGLRLNSDKNSDQGLISRSVDWSQVRPEWGLAGCSAFVIAPREKTKSLNLEGKSFLHSYTWEKDPGFQILEVIMTAPMVVTSWINLQYFASTVDNTHLGAGNKTLHNVTGGIGVLEGFSGDLRVGLPMQSIHDGEKFQHEPARLNVVINAPLEAINGILAKHQNIRNLFDNKWIFLLALDETGKVSHKYSGNLEWIEVEN
ncbi:hypothetical protein DFQ04_0109 [Algoriphagus boseongensis]|uniref:Probable inorganic carbon transporter subunit DabA n=1 Tax=Algoriphagus boseongensis TaxID=1442587 RepID=A0A4R6T5W5_9BACT|nr:DUF2309 domain-containing protein [Algoriphagus boseongensis]TDQ18310.1 hypothetical protein DFQ04_0109 [Algoriphagus boseongensis]